MTGEPTYHAAPTSGPTRPSGSGDWTGQTITMVLCESLEDDRWEPFYSIRGAR